jgi:hypothetical protein
LLTAAVDARQAGEIISDHAFLSLAQSFFFRAAARSDASNYNHGSQEETNALLDVPPQRSR